ncbi:energy transducer TonB [Sphingobium scionense]|uniref:TonB family protein n=2 Tax=Sphingobium scionense TaxID=1404341 RepID=A0A7W6LY87_9SPHN|nr:TonB family protein [Sphingobium scionense]
MMGAVVMLLAAAAVTPDRPLPVVYAMADDHALVALADTAQGEAEVRITLREGTDMLDCRPTLVSGNKAVGPASCRLVMRKLGWLSSLPAADGKSTQIPAMVVRWFPVPHRKSATVDYGGASPINPTTWVTPDDYVIAGDGTTRMAITIDASGIVSQCRVLQSSGNSQLDEHGCALTRQRAHFLPATDEQGVPHDTQGVHTVTWLRP